MGPNLARGKEISALRELSLKKGGEIESFDWLLDIACGISKRKLHRIKLFPQEFFEIKITLDELSKLWNIHLKNGTPIQHLAGRSPWRDFIVDVNDKVLIPRNETELLIDLALEKVNKNFPGRWCDLGTGSGVLSIALAMALPKWTGHAVDISYPCIEIAQKNMRNLMPKSKVNFYLGDWWEPLRAFSGKFNLVVSNPPYIPQNKLSTLDKSVRNFEPRLALSGGCDGLECSKKIISGAVDALASKGWLMLEHHFDQSEITKSILVDFGFINVSHAFDFSGVKRFALGQKK